MYRHSMESTGDVSRKRAELRRHPLGYRGRDDALFDLAYALYDRYMTEGEIDDLNEAIALHRGALELRPIEDNKYRRSTSLHNLALCLGMRYANRGGADDLDEAIALGRKALALRPVQHLDRGDCLSNVACNLRRRFQKQAIIPDLEEAIELLRAALALCSPGHPGRSASLHELSLCLSNRYDNQGVIADLEEAVGLGREALELCPPKHPDRAKFLNNLACNLWTWFQKQADMHALEEAIELYRAAVQLRPSGHFHLSSSLQNLALCLSDRYNSQGGVADLEEAVMLGREALKLCPPGHPDHDDCLSNLACNLWMRFQKQAAIRDLDEAIALYRAALQLRPPGHPHLLSSLHNLALCLLGRYDNQEVAADLIEAATLGRAALELCPPGHPDRGDCLSNLACALRKKFEKHRDKRDLDEAIELHRTALQLRPSGHPQQWSSLHELASCLSVRYDNLGVVAGLKPPGHRDRGTDDLDEAIALAREAMQLLIPKDPRYDMSRRSLTLYRQKKTRSRSATPSSNALPVTHFEKIIREVAFETLKTMPPRLLDTVNAALCNRDSQISHFTCSRQYNQLLSSCATCDSDRQMELIHTEVSRYFRFVTLSHRWGPCEPSLRDIEGHLIFDMPARGGFKKLQDFCNAALDRGYLWAWSDTCCIDKNSSAELQEAIGSMFTWYRQSALTIVYLFDVPNTESFGCSEWFRRGWTLQELLAPENILFYTQSWSLYAGPTSSNHKADFAVLKELERATGIDRRFLTNFSPGVGDARSKLRWASFRCTTRPEDIAYSLFGIFSIHLPIFYGETAEKALYRLLAEIISQSGDISILDWTGEASKFHSCFPSHITSYQRLPLFPFQPNAEEHATTRIARRATEQPAWSLLYDSLTKSPLPRFINGRLILPCIAYAVTAVQQQKSTNPSARSYTYRIQASGLRALGITLPNELETGRLQLVRPWHSKLLGPSTELYATPEQQLLSTLGKPFNALLLIELPHNEYKRIASSIPITAQPVDSASILKSEVRRFDIV